MPLVRSLPPLHLCQLTCSIPHVRASMGASEVSCAVFHPSQVSLIRGHSGTQLAPTPTHQLLSVHSWIRQCLESGLIVLYHVNRLAWLFCCDHHFGVVGTLKCPDRTARPRACIAAALFCTWGFGITDPSQKIVTASCSLGNSSSSAHSAKVSQSFLGAQDAR